MLPEYINLSIRASWERFCDINCLFYEQMKSLARLRCRRRRYYHSCLLVGPVISGEPVASFNRRIIWVPTNSSSVVSGSFDAVRHGGGKIKEIEAFGRVTVPFEKHLSIVETWVGEALDRNGGGISTQVIAKVQARMNEYEKVSDVKAMELEIFTAVIVNKMENEVFVYRKPTSFP